MDRGREREAIASGVSFIRRGAIKPMIGYLNGRREEREREREERRGEERRRERFLQSGEWNGIVLSGAVINWAAEVAAAAAVKRPTVAPTDSWLRGRTKGD